MLCRVKLGNVYKLGESGEGSSTATELDISINTENSAVFSQAGGCTSICPGISCALEFLV